MAAALQAHGVVGLTLCDAGDVMAFELRRRDTGGLVHRYATEGAALAFMRDVLRIVGREQAARFALDERDAQGQARPIAEGMVLVQRAVEDRAE